MDIKESVEDNTLRDQMENGATFTRPRFSRMRRTWAVNYKLLKASDRAALRAFRDTVGGSVNFNFTLPGDTTAVNVRFSKLPVITDDKFAGGEKRFATTFEITEL